MKSFIRNSCIHILPCIMLGIMGLLVANKGFYSHSHKLHDGSIVVHAHPYDKSEDSKPCKSHHHTGIEFMFYENIDILFFVLFLIFAFLSCNAKISYLINTEQVFVQFFSYSHKGRAPPV